MMQTKYVFYYLKNTLTSEVKFRGLMGKHHTQTKLQIPSRHDSKHLDRKSTNMSLCCQTIKFFTHMAGQLLQTQTSIIQLIQNIKR